jgi:hypothetical protein
VGYGEMAKISAAEQKSTSFAENEREYVILKFEK